MRYSSIEVLVNRLEKDFGNSHIVTIPLDVFNGVKNILEGKLCVGQTEVDVLLIPNFTKNRVEIREELLTHFNLDTPFECYAKIEGNQLKLGPVIGVFTSNGAIRKANMGIPKFRTVELAKANQDAKTILYFFSVKDMDFVNNRVYGTYFDKHQLKFQQKYFPLPDVLYDRGGGTLKKQRVISKYIRKQLGSLDDLKKINPAYYFSKWDLYNKLVDQDDIKPYIPFTCLYKEPNDIRRMFKKGEALYLKDAYGSNGRGIMRITHFSNGTFGYSYFDKKVISRRINTFEELIKDIERFFKNKKFIVQVAIDLIQLNGNSVDMRATVQRDGRGEFHIACYPVRIAQNDSPVTSTKSGSCVYPFETFFTEMMGYNEDAIQTLRCKIEEFLRIAFICTEKAYGKFGEIGIDFALDKNHRLWFIECNAKPGKDTLYYAHGEDIIRKAFVNPLDYAKYISGFSNIS